MNNHHNKQFRANIMLLLSDFFPHVNVRFIFENKWTIGSMLPYKDRVPTSVRSNIVYKYQCGMCNSSYIGESVRHYSTRIAEHRGIFPRTGAPMSRVNSNIYNHFFDTGHPICDENFTIIGSADAWNLKTAESIAIHQYKPSLNATVCSTPLNILT